MQVDQFNLAPQQTCKWEKNYPSFLILKNRFQNYVARKNILLIFVKKYL